MAKKRSLAVMVVIETNDPHLFPENLDVSTARATAQLRQRVIAELPALTRVVLIVGEEEARLMCRAHTSAMEAMGDGARLFRPPPEYVPPTRE